MYERGVRATSVDDVLRAAGAGKSQLYHYFGTKDDVAAAVLERQLATVLEQQQEFRLGTWSGLRGWFDALLEGQEARGYRGCPVGSLAVEMAAMGPEMASRVGTAFARWETTLEEGFTEMRHHARLRLTARPKLLATVTLAQVQGGYLLSTASHDLEPMRKALGAAYLSLRSYAP